MSARLGAEQGWIAEHRSTGGAGEGGVPYIAWRITREFQLQGLRPCSDGEHPRVMSVRIDARYRSAAYQEAAGNGYRALLHGDRSRAVPNVRRIPVRCRAVLQRSARD